MGGVSSHENEDNSTPPRTESHSRLLGFDPRSPSTDISRTPIVVDKTPEHMLDPRSPTAGIWRTPIVLEKCDAPGDPRSPTAGIERTPLPHSSEKLQNEGLQFRGVPVFPDMDTSLDDDPAERETDSKVGSEDAAVMDRVNPDIENLQIEDTEHQALVMCMQDNETEKTGKSDFQSEQAMKKKNRSAQPKELFPSKKHIALQAKQGKQSQIPTKNTGFNSPRSPLSTRNIDMNSPLQIVQRKQTKKVDNARNCTLEASSIRFIAKDKENMGSH